jgi:hypothetical protein
MGKVNEKKAKRKPKSACEGKFWPYGNIIFGGGRVWTDK